MLVYFIESLGMVQLRQIIFSVDLILYLPWMGLVTMGIVPIYYVLDIFNPEFLLCCLQQWT